MKQPILKLPFKGKLKCAQSNLSKFPRTHNKLNKNARYAIDFTRDGKQEFKVLARANGKVKTWRCCNHNNGSCTCGLGFGNQIRIHHKNYFTFYSHLKKILVKNNQVVNQGQVIGLAGKTGLAGDVHLHWSLGKESKKSKPIQKKFIPFWSVKANNIKLLKKKSVSSTYFKQGNWYE